MTSRWYYGINEQVKLAGLNNLKSTADLSSDVKAICKNNSLIAHPNLLKTLKSGRFDINSMMLDLANVKIVAQLIATSNAVKSIKFQNCKLDREMLVELADRCCDWKAVEELEISWMDEIDSPLQLTGNSIDLAERKRQEIDQIRRARISGEALPPWTEEEDKISGVSGVFAPFFSAQVNFEILKFRACHLTFWEVNRWALIAPKLKFLDLFANPLGDEGVKALADKLTDLPVLEQLGVAETRMTEIGALALLKILGGSPISNDDVTVLSNKQKDAETKAKKAKQPAEIQKEIIRNTADGYLIHRKPQFKVLYAARNNICCSEEVIKSLEWGYKGQVVLTGNPFHGNVKVPLPDDYGWRAKI